MRYLLPHLHSVFWKFEGMTKSQSRLLCILVILWTIPTCTSSVPSIPSVWCRAGLGKATNVQTARHNEGNIVEIYLELAAFHHLELVLKSF